MAFVVVFIVLGPTIVVSDLFEPEERALAISLAASSLLDA